MSPVQAVQTCLTKYTDFSGRASRSEYWWFGGFVLGGMALLMLVDYFIFGDGIRIGSYNLAPLSEVFVLATALPGWAVGVRRMQDSGQDGRAWFWLLAVIYGASYGATMVGILGWYPDYEQSLMFLVVALVVVIILIGHLIVALKQSEISENAYGPNPIEEAG